MKKIENLMDRRWLFVIIAPKSSSGLNLEIMKLIDDMSIISILPKLQSQRQKVKLKFEGTFPLTFNYFVILILIIEKN